jgi:Fibronectin type III domain
MAQVKLNFRKLSVTEKIARARQIVKAMTDNSASFSNPIPPLADITASIDAVEQANADTLKARALSKQRTAILEEKVDVLDDGMIRLASFVNAASGGKEEVILSAGMDVRTAAVPSNFVPDAPNTITPTMGDHEGEIDLAWNAKQGAQSYIVQSSPNPPKDDSWTQVAVVTASKCTITGLTSGTKYWFRVAAVGSGGQSGWSDPAVKMAP